MQVNYCKSISKLTTVKYANMSTEHFAVSNENSVAEIRCLYDYRKEDQISQLTYFSAALKLEITSDNSYTVFSKTIFT